MSSSAFASLSPSDYRAAALSTRKIIETSSYTTTRSSSPNPPIPPSDTFINNNTTSPTFASLHAATLTLSSPSPYTINPNSHSQLQTHPQMHLKPSTAAARSSRAIIETASYTTTGSNSPHTNAIFNQKDSHRAPPDAEAIHAADAKLEAIRKIQIQLSLPHEVNLNNTNQNENTLAQTYDRKEVVEDDDKAPAVVDCLEERDIVVSEEKKKLETLRTLTLKPKREKEQEESMMESICGHRK